MDHKGAATDGLRAGLVNVDRHRASGAAKGLLALAEAIAAGKKNAGKEEQESGGQLEERSAFHDPPPMHSRTRVTMNGEARPESAGFARDLEKLLSGAILTIEEAIVRFGRGKRNGRVVFTNGCFDILHPGHVRTLEEARGLGDALIVGINSDASVRRLKGPGRPVIPERERGEVLAALECVDAVVIFEEDTPQTVIARLLPDILVKGGDWAGDQIVGRAEVEAVGGRIARIPVLPGYSTTEILRKVREGTGSGSLS